MEALALRNIKSWKGASLSLAFLALANFFKGQFLETVTPGAFLMGTVYWIFFLWFAAFCYSLFSSSKGIKSALEIGILCSLTAGLIFSVGIPFLCIISTRMTAHVLYIILSAAIALFIWRLA